MIQDIEPFEFNNQYAPVKPEPGNIFITCRNTSIIASMDGNNVALPTFEMLYDPASAMEDAIYAFSIDDMPIYLLIDQEFPPEGFDFIDIHKLYDADLPWIPLAAATGLHLTAWYRDNRFCGRCGEKFTHHKSMRALQCLCGNLQFPKIAPVILAAIVNNGRIVATRYRGRPYKGLALNAGFVEIGESLEQAVRREVEEEVGLKVSRIHYYASQPWGITGIVMAGYFVEIEGDDTITIDEDELAEAVWFTREELPEQTNKMSLTARMFEAFRRGEVQFSDSNQGE